MTAATQRIVAVVVLAMLAAAACSSAGSDSARQDAAEESTTITTNAVPAAVTASPGCDAEEAATGITDRTITSGGEERAFRLVVPETYDGTTPLPVVFGFHGLTVDYRVIPGMSGFEDMAETYDFIGVAPSGRLDGTVPYWTAVPIADNVETTFVGDLLDLLEAELCIDPSQVFSTGMSNGGQMSSLLACQLDDRFTAVAPLAGVEWSNDVCTGRPVPVMAFHGDEDPIVTYEGGGLNAAAIADLHNWKGDVPPGVPEHGGVDQAMASWADHNGCDAEPVVEDVSDEVQRYEWQNCDAETVLYRVVGGGHTWPGKPVPGFEATFGHTTTDIDATALMFEFFFDQP
jgi:polyhydroxybutyrate depolymerase